METMVNILMVDAQCLKRLASLNKSAIIRGKRNGTEILPNHSAPLTFGAVRSTMGTSRMKFNTKKTAAKIVQSRYFGFLGISLFIC